MLEAHCSLFQIPVYFSMNKSGPEYLVNFDQAEVALEPDIIQFSIKTFKFIMPKYPCADHSFEDYYRQKPRLLERY